MNVFLTILVLIAILVILIATHEAGHLAMAKAFNVYCLEYSIGFGPKLFSKKRKKGETVFSIRAVPLGGYVSMYGEGVELPEGVEVPLSRSLNGISAPRRALVLSAGIMVNLFTSILFCFIFATCFPDQYMVTQFDTGRDATGQVIPSGDTETARVRGYGFWIKGQAGTYVVEEQFNQILYSPAIAYDDNNNQIGFIIDCNADYNGESVVAVYLYDSVVNDQSVFSSSALSLYHQKKEGYFPTAMQEYMGLTAAPDISKGKITIAEGDSLTLHFSIVPISSGTHAPSASDFQAYIAGGRKTYEMTSKVTASKTYDQSSTLYVTPYTHWGTFGERMQKGCDYYAYFFEAIGQGLGSIFSGNLSNLGSIVAMGSVIDTSAYQIGWGVTFFFYGAFLALNLAIFNLLPFPGLDGWQLLVTFVEGVFKKKIPEKVKNAVSAVGLALLLGLSVFIIIKDIVGLF